MKKINILLNQLSKYKEAFSTWKYRVPRDKEYQLYDFYVLMSLNRSAITDDNLAVAYDEAMETIVNYLYPELLEAVFFAICCEFVHVFDLNFTDDIVELAAQLGNISQEEIDAFLDVYFNNKPKTYEEAHTIVLTGLKKSGIIKYDFVKLSEISFSRLNWNPSYGGKKWAVVSQGWLQAIKAETKSIKEKAMAIDLMYSLQHNTSTILNKLDSYYKRGYSWILTALEKKFHSTNPTVDLWQDASHGLKPFAAAVYKNTTGKTIEESEETRTGFATLQPHAQFKTQFKERGFIEFQGVPVKSINRVYGKTIKSYINGLPSYFPKMREISAYEFYDYLTYFYDEDAYNMPYPPYTLVLFDLGGGYSNKDIPNIILYNYETYTKSRTEGLHFFVPGLDYDKFLTANKKK